MKRIIIFLVALGMLLNICCIVVFADKVMEPISGWEESFWQYPSDLSGLTPGGTGVETTNDPDWVYTGSGALHVWCEKSAANLNSQAVQTVEELEQGKKYRFTGKIYISSSSWGFGLYLGDTRLTMLRELVQAGQWCDVDYTFTVPSLYKDFKLQVAQIGDLYADDLSLKEIIEESPEKITYGPELLENNDFEDEFLPAAEIENLKAQVYDKTVELTWTYPDDSTISSILVYDDDTLLEELPFGKQSLIIDNLENGKQYTFTVKTKTIKGVLSEGVSVQAIPIKKIERPKVIKDDESNKIVGLTTDMEYSVDGGITWTRYDAIVEPVFNGDKTVWVRIFTEEPGVDAPVQILYFTQNNQDDEEIIVTKSQLKENTYTVCGMLNQKVAARVTMVMIQKDADRRDTEKILAIGQTNSNENGEFEFTVKLADMRNGAVNDGEYEVYIDSTVTDEVMGAEVVFVNSKTRESAFDMLWTQDEIYDLFEEDSEVYNAYASIGFPVSDYSSRGSLKRNIIDDFKIQLANTDSSIGYDAAVKLFAQALVMNVLKDADPDAVYDIIQKYNDVLNLEYNGITWSELLKNDPSAISNICNYMSKKEYKNAEDISKNFAAGYGLYRINAATYGEICEVIMQYETVLGLDSQYYKEYIGLDDESDEKINISKKLVLAKSKTPFTDAEALLSAIKNAVEEIQDEEKETGGGGGGGSSVSSGSSFSFTPTQTQTEQPNQDKNPVFADMESAPWAEDAVRYLYSNKIISGYEDGCFAPNKTITREEFVSILVRAFGISSDKKETEFEDVKQGQWYYDAVINAANAQIITGIGDGLFGVNMNITRQDLAVMIYRCIAGDEQIQTTNQLFSDMNEVSSYAYDAVIYMKTQGYISGYADLSFRPAQTATRAEVAQILYSILTDERE